MHIDAYLYFDGRGHEAIDFYKRSLGAEVQMLMRFAESPEPHPPGALPPGADQKVMHASLRIGDTNILISDGRCGGKPDFRGFGLALTARDDAEAERLFAALGEGGRVEMPMTKTFFSSRFGMVADRFGVTWLVLVAA
jgi:PhnB protein